MLRVSKKDRLKIAFEPVFFVRMNTLIYFLAHHTGVA